MNILGREKEQRKMDVADASLSSSTNTVDEAINSNQKEQTNRTSDNQSLIDKPDGSSIDTAKSSVESINSKNTVTSSEATSSDGGTINEKTNGSGSGANKDVDVTITSTSTNPKANVKQTVQPNSNIAPDTDPDSNKMEVDDDDLINKLAEIEGTKKELKIADEVVELNVLNALKSDSELQRTSDLLKDLQDETTTTSNILAATKLQEPVVAQSGNGVKAKIKDDGQSISSSTNASGLQQSSIASSSVAKTQTATKSSEKIENTTSPISKESGKDSGTAKASESGNSKIISASVSKVSPNKHITPPKKQITENRSESLNTKEANPVEMMEVDSAEKIKSKSDLSGKTPPKLDTDKRTPSSGSAVRSDSTTGNSTVMDKSPRAVNVSSSITPPKTATSKAQNMDDSIDSSTKPRGNVENKFLAIKKQGDGRITPNVTSPASGLSNVLHSTPIEKQFEISSENVSKISELTTNTPRNSITEKSPGYGEEPSTSENPCSDDQTSDAIKTATESDVKSDSSDPLTRYSKTIQSKFNGFLESSSAKSDQPGTSKQGSSPKTKKLYESDEIASTSKANYGDNYADSSTEIEKDDPFRLSIWYDDKEFKYMAVERMVTPKKSDEVSTLAVAATSTTSATDVTTSTSEKGSTHSGSVGSIGPFNLPGSSGSMGTTATAPTLSSSGSTLSSTSSQQYKVSDATYILFKGTVQLCDYMIDHFQSMKKRYTLSIGQTSTMKDEKKDIKLTQTSNRGRKKTKLSVDSGTSQDDVSVATTVSATDSSTPKKRGAPFKRIHLQSESDGEPKSKQIKSNKKSITPPPGQADVAAIIAASTGDSPHIGSCCLAKWVDRKFYAGRITDAKPGNKYVVLFNDGATKMLPQDHIVFGKGEILPLLNEHVHVLVDEDTYEPGKVIEQKQLDEQTFTYTVEAESKTVTVPISEIYLEIDQAKYIKRTRESAETNDSMPTKESIVTVASGTTDGVSLAKRAGRPPAKLDDTSYRSTSGTPTNGRGGGSARKSNAAPITSPEPGTSDGTARKGLRNKRPETIVLPRVSECSDISDSLDSPPASPEYASPLEAIDGCQPELQKTPKESEIAKMCLIAEYLGNGVPTSRDLEDILGPISGISTTLFHNKHFVLTCTIPIKLPKDVQMAANVGDLANKYTKFTALPFVKEHLYKQIELAGGCCYKHFEDIPKKIYKQCILISPHPCITAKYVQCLAANVSMAISHEWIIECCRMNQLVDHKQYTLPSGWSIIDKRYIRWQVGRSSNMRQNATPFNRNIVIIASMQLEFIEFWSRVCKLAGATIRLVKSSVDLTASTKGFLLIDEEFPEDIRVRAEHFGISTVSTVWVVQSLIHGKLCKPDSHVNLTKIYEYDDF